MPKLISAVNQENFQFKNCWILMPQNAFGELKNVAQVEEGEKFLLNSKIWLF